MKIFDFIKDAGEKIADVFDINEANASENKTTFEDVIRKNNLKIENLNAKKDGETVVLTGTATSQEDAEKAILIAGNIKGVSKVESKLNVESNSDHHSSNFYTVESGDTLSRISKEVYGDSSQYMKIFEANKPMLKSPDEIYPGQTLRIPSQDAQSKAA